MSVGLKPRASATRSSSAPHLGRNTGNPAAAEWTQPMRVALEVEFTAPSARTSAPVPHYEPVVRPTVPVHVDTVPSHPIRPMAAEPVITHSAPAAAPKPKPTAEPVVEAGVSRAPVGLTTAEKREMAEVAGRRAPEYAKGVRFPTKLRGNRGIDGMDVFFDPAGKIDGIDIVVEIIITESKFATGGGFPKLARTRDGVQQLSPAWMKKQMDILEKSGLHPETLRILKENPDKIRFKANVHDEFGVNRWYDYGYYDPSNFREFNATRTPKATGGE